MALLTEEFLGLLKSCVRNCSKGCPISAFNMLDLEKYRSLPEESFRELLQRRGIFFGEHLTKDDLIDYISCYFFILTQEEYKLLDNLLLKS